MGFSCKGRWGGNGEEKKERGMCWKLLFGQSEKGRKTLEARRGGETAIN